MLPTVSELAARWGRAADVEVVEIVEKPPGVWRYDILSGYSVYVSQGDPEPAHWACKHCLRALSEGISRRYGWTVLTFLPAGIQPILEAGQFLVLVDGDWLCAIVKERVCE